MNRVTSISRTIALFVCSPALDLVRLPGPHVTLFIGRRDVRGSRRQFNVADDLKVVGPEKPRLFVSRTREVFLGKHVKVDAVSAAALELDVIENRLINDVGLVNSPSGCGTGHKV